MLPCAFPMNNANICVWPCFTYCSGIDTTQMKCVWERERNWKKNNYNWLFHCVLSLCLIWHYYFLSSFTTPSHSLCRSLIFMRIFLWLGYMERKWKKCEIPQKKLFIGPFFLSAGESQFPRVSFCVRQKSFCGKKFERFNDSSWTISHAFQTI